jgi:hypothetical protein
MKANAPSRLITRALPLLIALCSVLAPGGTSAQDFTPSSETIVGNWKGKNVKTGRPVQFNFSKDGTFTTANAANGSTTTGKWSANFIPTPAQMTLGVGAEAGTMIVEFLTKDGMRLGSGADGKSFPADFAQAAEVAPPPRRRQP